MRRTVAGMLLALASLLAGSAPPEAQSSVSLNADFIWGRRYHPHADNAVLVTIDNPGPAVRGELILRWGSSEIRQLGRAVTPETLENPAGPIYVVPVTVPEKTRRRHTASVRAGGQDERIQSLWVFLVSGRKCLARFAVTGTALKKDFAVVGQVGLGQASGLEPPLAQTAIARPEDLPDRWHGYGALRALLWVEADAAQVREPDQILALRQWVAGGGHLVVGRSSTVGLAGTFLEELIPVTILGVRENDDWSALRDYAGGSPRGKGACLQVRPRGGRVLAGAGDFPLIVSAGLGRGRVTFLAFDPTLDPFDRWAGGDRLWRKLLDVDEAPVEEDRNRRNWEANEELSAALGSRDVAGLLGIHPGVPLPSLGWAFLMICVYVLVVGPLDYFALRLFRRLELTWITFPAYVIFFSGIAFLAGTTLTRIPPLAREIVVLDSLPDADLARGWSILTVLSPQERAIAVGASRGAAHVAPFFTLGRGWGAEIRITDSRSAEFGLSRGATGVTLLRWCEKGAAVRAEPDGPTRLKVTNGLGTDLRNVLYVKGGQAYELKGVPRGESTHELPAPLGDWRAAVRRRGVDAASQQRDRGGGEEWSYGPYGRQAVSEEAEVRQRMRDWMTWLSFARALPKRPWARPQGAAAEIDASAWIESGGALLTGWSEGPSVQDLGGVEARRVTDALVRVFIRHD